MHFSSLLLAATAAVASPLMARDQTMISALTVDSPFPIHESCNSTQRRQLTRGLQEAVILAEAAKAHLLQHGADSEIKQKYFGNGSTATPIGWYERIIAADRGAMTFRCDDPDENCATQNGWAGHWRGDNASAETVICDASYHKRLYLDSMCTRGYTVAGSALNLFWATDLLHRLLHVPVISEGIVDHFTEDYEGASVLAESDPAKASIDSDILQYFAVEVYAYDVAVPGEGCLGADQTTHSSATSTEAAASSATSSAAGTVRLPYPFRWLRALRLGRR
ncbi:hypothetical protein BROUX41_000698 [Berkeleyomyces rouxiae]|uniref:uncharacterized protein n=1 Tax=Berkeleyomyces rouxiae TaxID=2035830 RepID=UPI003B7A364F